MTWNRTVFVGTSLTNSNNGVISVEDSNASNKIKFIIAENALSYNLYGRVSGTSNWTLIENLLPGDLQVGDPFFVDNFSWIPNQNIVNIEYKVEVEKNSPETTLGHYISEFEGNSGEPGGGGGEPGGGDVDFRTIDRSPFYINYFASFSGFRESYGIAGGVDGGRSDWLHTPAFGNVSALQNPEQNGRLFYVQQQIINKPLAGGRMFNRVMIGNPAGFVAGDPLSGNLEDNQGYFTNKAGTGMLLDGANSYDTRSNNSLIGQDTEIGLVNTYPTPFTPNGLPGEEARGDQVSSWKVATDALRAAGVQEVFCYIGYGQAYETSSKDFIDDDLLAFSPGWARSEKEPSVYPADEWQRQWDILSQCGFDNASFDAGTRIARSNNESDYLAGDQRIETIANIVGTDNQIFELIPRDPDGGMKLNGTWDYTKNKGWGLFPISSGVFVPTSGENGEFIGKVNTGSQFVIDFTTWDLDPATTEHHAVLDLQSLITAPWVNNTQGGKTPNGRLMVFSEFKKLVNTLLSKGLVVSATSWSSSLMVDDINGGTVGPGDLCDYILNPDASGGDVGSGELLEPGLARTWNDTPQPASYSDGGDHPADQQTLPIARWNVIPMQVIDSDGFNIGVVAFHANGIDRVEFQANNGPVTTVNEMTRNPRTGNREYWVTLQAPENNDLIEIRAIVYPKDQGKPFVLQNTPNGDVDYLNNPEHLLRNIAGGGTEVISEGEHSMFLWGPAKYANAPTVIVPTGNGSGTAEDPYDGLKWTYRNFTGQKENAKFVIQTPGVYETSAYEGGPDDVWVTFSADPSLDQTDPAQQVILGRTGFSGPKAFFTWSGPKYTKFENITVDDEVAQYMQPNQNGSYFWFKNTYHYDSENTNQEGDRRQGQGLINGNGKTYAQMVDGCRVSNRYLGFGGSTIIRNTDFTGSRDTDVFSLSRMLLDCTASDSDISPGSGAHIDGVQHFGSNAYKMNRNRICFGLRIWNVKNFQPFLLDATNSIFERIAYVDYACEWTDGGTEGNNMFSLSDHIFISNCSFTQWIKAGRPTTGVYTNSLIQNSTFKFWDSNVGRTNVPTGIWVRNCLFQPDENTLSAGSGSNGTGKWEGVLRDNFTLSYDNSINKFVQVLPQSAIDLRGIPLPGFNDDPPIGIFE